MNMKRTDNTVRRTIVLTLNRYHLKKKLYPLAIGLLLFAGVLRAQDAHYSQYYHAPALVNPALTGIYRGDVRFMANYRSQWHAVPVNYNTFTGFADMKFIKRTDRKGFFSGRIGVQLRPRRRFQAGAGQFECEPVVYQNLQPYRIWYGGVLFGR